MPNDVRTAVANEKRPLPPVRRKMIRILVDEMRKIEKNPTKTQCLTVALKIVKEYPKSFADYDNTESVSEVGCYSLLKQIKTRVEHVNRNNTLTTRRRCSSGISENSEITKRRGPVATYGCTKWQPEPPLLESDDDLEHKRQTLQNIYQQHGKSGADRADVCALMKETYYLQRKHINDAQATTIKEMKNKWPYLFVQKHLTAHFEELTSINVQNQLNRTMEDCGTLLINFFRNKPTNELVKKILSADEEVGITVAKLLLAHFREDQDGLLLYADVSKQKPDVSTVVFLY